MKIFFLGTDYPYPGYSGACVVNWSIVNYLIDEGHDVTLFVDPPRLTGTQIGEEINDMMKEKIKSLKCDIVPLNHLYKKIRKKNLIQAFFSNKFEDYFSSCFLSEEIEKILKKNVDEIKPDLLLCYGSPAIHWAKNINTKKAGYVHVPSAISYANLIINYEIEGLSFRVIKDFVIYLKARLFDKKLIKEANEIDIRFHHSKDFCEIMLERGLKDCKNLFTPYFDHRKYYNKEIVREKRKYFKIIIVGLMSTVNRAQYYTLQKYVLPYLEKNLDMKKVQFHMIGVNHEDMPKYFRDKDYIFAKGYVEDFNFELQDCDLFYCYTPFVLGLRTRLLDALNFQTAIITSKNDIKSLPFLEHKNNCYVAQNEKNIGALIIEIMDDKNIENIRNNARKTYENNISIKIAGKKYAEAILYDKS